MKIERGVIFGRALIFAVLFATLAFASFGIASAAQTHYVNPGESIQAAIDNANAGDTIIVRDGTYTENVDVNVNHLTIKSEHGADSTIVQAASTSDNVFAVTADYVNISGFTVKNATENYKAGIYLFGVVHCNISDNNASNNYFGIELFFSSNNTLTNNILNSNKVGISIRYNSYYSVVTNNTFVNDGLSVGGSKHSIKNNTVNGKPLVYLEEALDYKVEDAGQVILVNCENITVENLDLSNTTVGVDLYKSSNCKIMNNTANSNSRVGIYLGYSSNNTLVNNTANSNSNDGIHLSSSSNNTLVNNTANSNSNDGVYLYASGRNTLTGNTANSNRGNGIYLYATPTKNNTLTNNTANSNLDCGIYLWFSGKNNTLANNTVNSNSDYGICLKSSSDNRIYNNYLNNRNNAYDEGNNTWNIAKTLGTNIIGGPYLGGNYWSDYTGKDSDGDGLGDTMLPYNSSDSIQNDGDWLPLVKPSAP